MNPTIYQQPIRNKYEKRYFPNVQQSSAHAPKTIQIQRM